MQMNHINLIFSIFPRCRKCCYTSQKTVKTLHWALKSLKIKDQQDYKAERCCTPVILTCPCVYRCLAFTSRRCTAALMDVVSAGPSPPALVLLTANATRETFRAALGKLSMQVMVGCLHCI